MKLEQYCYRQIRAYVAKALKERRSANICLPPDGTHFRFKTWGTKSIITLILCDNKTKKTIITIAHNHTRAGDIWVGPIDATKLGTQENVYMQLIRNRLLKNVMS